MGATERIAAAIGAPEKPKRKYTVSEAKLEQLKMAREKAAAAKAKKKPVAKPVEPAPAPPPRKTEGDHLKAQIAEAVAAALKAQKPLEIQKAPRKAPRATGTVSTDMQQAPPPPPPPRPSREDLLMKIIRGY